jgi:PPOX class probable F420-dependent enzyme
MIPEKYRDLLTNKHIAHLATVNPDGSPQISPIWIDYNEEEEFVMFNTARGRIKERNILNNNQVALSIRDNNDPYRYLLIQGKVVDINENGAANHIGQLGMRYMNKEFPVAPGDTRIIVSIKPHKVVVNG